MIRFNIEVALQAVLYVLSRMGGQCDMHKVCKILYFADREHLSKYGRSITRDEYIKMQYGPVPSRIDDAFKAVRGDSFFPKTEEAKHFATYFSIENRYMVCQQQAVNLDYLSDSDVECLDYAVALCGSMSFEELTEFSHGMAWHGKMPNRMVKSQCATCCWKQVMKKDMPII